MRSRILQYADDEACLILGRDRGVAPCTTKRNGHPSLADHRRKVEQPFREEGRLEVDRRYARPIEYALAQPMLTRGVAFRVAARGYLRHVDDHFDSGLLGGLSELSGRLQDAWTDRIAEVRPLHSVQRGTHSVKIEEVPEHDFNADILQ